jgi:dihydroorotate dehydrogenase (fumarate)
MVIIGVGGVFHGHDVFEYLLAGANLIGVGTAFLKSGIKVFKKIGDELKSILVNKNYKAISSVKRLP